MPRRTLGGLVSFISVIMGLVSCSANDRLYSGSLGGQQVTLVSRTSRNPFDHSVTPVLRVGNLPELAMAYESSTVNVPYSMSIYEGRRVAVLDADALERYGAQRGHSGVKDVVIYLDPKRFSAQQFDQYAAFFAQHWATVDAAVARVSQGQGFREIRPVALVHGTDDEFKRVYRHPNNSAGYLEVWTDGMVAYRTGNQGSSMTSTNLGQYLQMPGYRIVVSTVPHPFALEDVAGYVTSSGRSIGEDFKLVIE